MNLAKSLALSTAFAIGLGAVPALAQDTAKGKRLFKRCAACHTLEEGGKNKVGPNLFGILGRQIATAENFRFSNAFKELDFAWDEAKMDEFILAPKKMIPGTKMAFPGLRKEQDRADLIAYLMEATTTSTADATD